MCMSHFGISSETRSHYEAQVVLEMVQSDLPVWATNLFIYLFIYFQKLVVLLTFINN